MTQLTFADAPHVVTKPDVVEAFAGMRGDAVAVFYYAGRELPKFLAEGRSHADAERAFQALLGRRQVVPRTGFDYVWWALSWA